MECDHERALLAVAGLIRVRVEKKPIDHEPGWVHHADHLGDTIQSTAVWALAVRTRWSWNSACRN